MTWETLDTSAQKDLEAWYNISELDDDDKERLAELFEAGRFGAWDCPSCGERVFCGAPVDWGHFQGVLQVDYTSFPVSDKRPETWCDSCRMRGDVFDEPGNPVGTMPWDDREAFGNS